MTRRLAILTTFEGDMPFTASHPDDGAKVAAGLGGCRPTWQFDTWRTSAGEWPPDAACYDGLIITGSPASVNDEAPWIAQLKQLIRDRHQSKGAMLGLCFGHQAIASAMGGRVARSALGMRVGTASTQLDRTTAWMEPLRPAFTLYAAHDEQVVALPDAATCLGGDDGCAVGAYTIGDHVLGLQYHPEFSAAFMSDLLDTLAPKLSAEALALGRAQLAGTVDAPLVWGWIARFFDQAFSRS